ncbi:MAG TPA: hypothetical protein VNJ04_21090 [Gemmatimonadaceae bacterium]|nr:hypothetical protein [Gemmatimonadaceae bacterium]
MSTDVAPPLDWGVYRRFKAEGRINLLYRLSEPTAMKVWNVDAPAAAPPTNVITFISRAEHLRWRRNWQQGRFVRLAWPPDERAAVLRQDAIFREADAEWEKDHGPVPGGAKIIAFGVHRSGTDTAAAGAINEY